MKGPPTPRGIAVRLHRLFDLASTDAVFRAAGGDAEAVAGDADGLVVAGVDRGEVQGCVVWRLQALGATISARRESGAMAAAWAAATAGPAGGLRAWA